MGYYIKKVPTKQVGWRLQFVKYNTTDQITSSGMPKKSKITNVPQTDWLNHGFNPRMTYDEAKTLAKHLNAKAEEKRWAEKKVDIQQRLKLEQRQQDAYLPQSYIEEFEHRIIKLRLSRNDDTHSKRNKIFSHWMAAKRVICELKIDPSDWYEDATLFYDHFASKQISPSYVKKLLRLINLWGFFICKKQSKPFLNIPSPRGIETSRIADSYFNKLHNGKTTESDPLTPELLMLAKEKVKEETFNWLFISVWFGLRPSEIDNLFKEGKPQYLLYTDNQGTEILKVYQAKLKAIAREKRWKHIPVIYKEQKEAISILKTANFKRPINKIVHKYFGDNINLYGGRKGFVDLMLELGQNLEDISQWLGHTTIERTWRNYKNKNVVHYKVGA